MGTPPPKGAQSPPCCYTPTPQLLDLIALQAARINTLAALDKQCKQHLETASSQHHVTYQGHQKNQLVPACRGHNTEEEVGLHLLLAGLGSALSWCNAESKGVTAHSEWQSRTADIWHVPAPTQGLPLCSYATSEDLGASLHCNSWALHN